ncbi:MAG: ABC transporter ATP-binding protein [Planctomycetes bacterium]|nr:ABC transporter ATP-binding protein [Planctomycetota bacterium]
MTETTPSATFATLVRRIWAAMLQHKSLVATIVVLGFLEAAFTKLPLVLVKPLMAALNPGVEEVVPLPLPAGHHGPELPVDYGREFNVWFAARADALCAWFGIDFAGVTAMHTVIACGIVAMLCGLIGALTIYGVQITSRFFAIKMVADLRVEVARHILTLPLRFFGGRRMGELISKLTNDAQVLQRSFELAADNVVVDPLMILGNIAILAWFVPEAIFVLLALVPVMAIPMYRAGRRVRKRSGKSLQAMGDATESMNQILSGMRTVKAFQLEEQRLREFEGNTATFLQRTLKMLRAKGLSMAQTFVGYQFGFAVLLVLLGWIVLVGQGLGADDVALVIAPLTTTYQHVKRLTRSYHTLMESVGALDGIESILRSPSDAATQGGEPMPELRGAVELQDVWFGYGEHVVLRGLDLRVQPGQTVALVGPSGGGKSTTMDLLLRFHDPDRGRILVDGRDLKTVLLSDYRRHVAVVNQQPFLFNASIRDNIACGRPGATPQQIEAAARAANIHDFIVGLPQGYDTLAGERGCNLSGGQMQRITIARAIVRDPAILFLDEATSALDSENEGLVQRALDNLRRGRTSFVVAHRLSTIVDADLIVVLVDGRIVEQGSHAGLLARGGVYKRMHELQTAPA